MRPELNELVVIEPIEEEAFEYARYDPITSKWRKPFLAADPHQWSDANGNVDRPIESISLGSDRAIRLSLSSIPGELKVVTLVETTDLREVALAAQSAANSKSNFLASMSHEIRTPMNGLKVGITRDTQVPTRWIDQGASSVIILAEVPYRRLY